MKPKTIAELLRDYGLHYYDPNAPREDAFKLIGDDAVEELVAQIQQLLEECAPEEIEEGDGWDIYFSQSDTLGMGGKVIKKGKARSCCPGDDIAYAHNQAIDQYKSNIRGKLK